jgi:hypothetical protein
VIAAGYSELHLLESSFTPGALPGVALTSRGAAQEWELTLPRRQTFDDAVGTGDLTNVDRGAARLLSVDDVAIFTRYLATACSRSS